MNGSPRLAHVLSAPSDHQRKLKVSRAAAVVAERLELRRLLSGNVLSYHDDVASTGQNLAETTLTPANVNVTDFGKEFATGLDGQVYAQPLYILGVNITGGTHQGTHNVVYVATEHDSLYAIDGDSGTILWQDSFINPAVGITTVPATDTSSGNITPEIGITATPAIDPSTGFLFLTAKTKQIVNGNTAAPHYVYTLYKVNIQDGAFTNTVIGDTTAVGNPNNVAAYTYTYNSGPYVLDPHGAGDGVVTVSGQKRIYFNTLRQLNRPGITLANGSVYLAFGSHGDNRPYHGWILGYSESDLSATAVLNLNPDGIDDGVWQGGGRIVMDPQGYMYVETGNGTFDTTLNAQGFPLFGDYGDSFVKIGLDPTTTATNQNINGWGLKVVDYFTPSNQANLSSADADLGSGGPMILPDSVGSTAHPHLMVGAGKEGKIYLIDRDNMGKFSSTTDHVVQELGAAIGGGTLFNGSYGTPAFFNDGTNSRIYYVGQQDTGRSFVIANGAITATPDSRTPDTFGAHGSTPSISANGTSNGIVWDLEFNSNQLRAYNASNYGTELWTSAQAGARDQLGGAVLFAVPTIINGEVFVGTSNSLVAYGEFAPPTSIPDPPTNLVATPISGVQINLTWVDNANNEAGYDIEESADGGNTWTHVTNASANSSAYAVGGLQPGTAYSFRVRAFNILGNSAYSNTASATTTTLAPALDFSAGFANASTVLQLNRNAVINGTTLELTDGNNNEVSSAFSKNAISIQRFNTAFTFQLTNAAADGFTFTIQGIGPTAIGGGGGGLGYAGIGGQSLAIKFDIYNNSTEGTDSTGLFVAGDPPGVPSGNQPVEALVDMTPSGVLLNSGDILNATLHYDGTTLQETVNDTRTGATFAHSYVVNIPSFIGNNAGYVGFTGATGGLASIQQILNWSYTPLPAPPAIPTNFTVTPASGTELDLAWSETSTPIDHFTILRKAPADASYTQLAQVPGTQMVYMDTGLAQNATYLYEVVATNASGDSLFAGPVSGTTPTAPAAPTNLRVGTLGTTSLTLTWQDNANNETGYKVMRQLESNETFQVATLPAGSTSYTDPNVLAGAAYQYTISAFNLAGPSTGATMELQTIPAAPTGLAAAGGGRQVTLHWDTYGHAVSGYNVYRSTSPGGENATPIASNVAGTTFTDTSLTPGTTYYYEIAAVDSSGEGAKAAEVSASTFIPGDVDGNGSVGFSDLLKLAQNYGATTATWAQGDLDGDGTVNFPDLLLLAQNYGRSATTPTAAAPAQTPLTAAITDLTTTKKRQPLRLTPQAKLSSISSTTTTHA
jgi:fibronectin type 3 domain-containing protein